MKACEALALPYKTYQRWKSAPTKDDQRRGPKTAPAHKLSQDEEKKIIEIACSSKYRHLSCAQIVSKLLDEGEGYIASERTFYRVLGKRKLHKVSRGIASPQHKPKEHIAIKPNQVWTWDITYLAAGIHGVFFKLYLFMDIFSRKVVGWQVHETESGEFASEILKDATIQEGVTDELVLHSDNGGPMKSYVFQATMEDLKITMSYSRRGVSDDNPYSESLFKTLKYPIHCPKPNRFSSIEEAREWVAGFVKWYNEEHYHSGINYVTPDSKHKGEDKQILSNRKEAYEKAKRANPRRWSQNKIKSFDPIEEVSLNPDFKKRPKKAA